MEASFSMELDFLALSKNPSRAIQNSLQQGGHHGTPNEMFAWKQYVCRAAQEKHKSLWDVQNVLHSYKLFKEPSFFLLCVSFYLRQQQMSFRFNWNFLVPLFLHFTFAVVTFNLRLSLFYIYKNFISVFTNFFFFPATQVVVEAFPRQFHSVFISCYFRSMTCHLYVSTDSYTTKKSLLFVTTFKYFIYSISRFLTVVYILKC